MRRWDGGIRQIEGQNAIVFWVIALCPLDHPFSHVLTHTIPSLPLAEDPVSKVKRQRQAINAHFSGESIKWAEKKPLC